jgi:hypothetical protein
MANPPPKQPKISAKGRAMRREREARLSEALRANLRKRKAQARGRAEAKRERGGGPDGPRDGGEA